MRMGQLNPPSPTAYMQFVLCGVWDSIAQNEITYVCTMVVRGREVTKEGFKRMNS